MRRLCVLFPFLIVLLAVSEARADLAPGPGFRPRPQPPVVPQPVPAPKAPKVEKMGLVIEIDNQVRIPRLQIPKTLLQGGAAGAGAAPGARAEAPAEEAQQRGDEGPRRLPTVIAGLALAFGFVSAGLWLVRRRGRRSTAALGVLVGMLVLGGAALWADIPPRPFPRPQPPVTPPQPVPALPAANLPQLVLPAGVVLPANIEVEVVEKGQSLKLILNKKMVLRGAGVRPGAAPGAHTPAEEQ